MSAVRVLAGYRLIFGALIIVASVQTLLAPRPDGHGVMLLAGVEIAGARGRVPMKLRFLPIGACSTRGSSAISWVAPQ